MPVFTAPSSGGTESFVHTPGTFVFDSAESATRVYRATSFTSGETLTRTLRFGSDSPYLARRVWTNPNQRPREIVGTVGGGGGGISIFEEPT